MELNKVFKKIDEPQCLTILTLTLAILFMTCFYYVSNNIKTILTKGDKQNSIYLDSLSKVVFSNRELLLDLNKKNWSFTKRIKIEFKKLKF